MTLDEAIIHAEEKAKEYGSKLKIYECINEDRSLFREEEMACKLCAEGHRQLAEWLKDYKRLLEQEPKTGHWIEGKYKDTCDKCRCTYPKNIGFKNYCPNCGAKMVEQQESEEA